jgi:hypothetical protein
MTRLLYSGWALACAVATAMVLSNIASVEGVPVDVVRTSALGSAGLIFAAVVGGSFLKRLK